MSLLPQTDAAAANTTRVVFSVAFNFVFLPVDLLFSGVSAEHAENERAQVPPPNRLFRLLGNMRIPLVVVVNMG
jgi:hypothetical protein